MKIVSRPSRAAAAALLVTGLAVPLAHAGSLSERVDETRMELARDPDSRQPLEAKDVEKLEKKLAEKPDDVEARLRLLNHYRMNRTPEAQTARMPHALWILENAPESMVASSESFVSKQRFPDEYAKIGKIWTKHLEDNPKSAKIAGNAAAFFGGEDRARAEELLKKAKELDPKNPRWTGQLANLYMRPVPELRAPSPENAKKALAQYEELLKSGDDRGRMRFVSQAAEAALAAGENERAAQLAQELLKASVGDFQYGEWIHEGHRILGHVALKADDVDTAKAELAKAGKTEGSRMMENIGPQLTLANALLKKGEKDAVVAYLEKVEKLWPRGADTVADWIEQIKKDEKPELDRFRAMRPEPGVSSTTVIQERRIDPPKE
jgi:tetratricopeptide (TPR) repeat protein